VQLDKRERKLATFDYGDRWAEIEGEGPLAVITFGSSTAPVREALARARAAGVHAKLVAMRLIAPARTEALELALDGVRHVLVVEQNHGAQFFHYLRGWFDLPGRPESFHRPGPLPLKPAELADAIVAAARRASPAAAPSVALA
jgi:2-oxoglutarate ferredoxin oxidoreductase subunit alpha